MMKKTEKSGFEIVSLDRVDLSAGGKPLLVDTDLKVLSNDRIGIIGRNGCGKSHLLKLLSGDLTAEGGTYSVSKNIKILLVKQELPDDDKSPIEYLKDNDRELSAIYDQIEADEDNNQIDILSNRAGEIELERYDLLAPKILMGLGLTSKQIEDPMRNLSGGLRMRIGMASVLVQEPDLLLLDEPTNHLDLESAQWLISYLKTYAKAFIIVSHDTKLLNTLTKKTLHLKQGNLIEFNGSYDEYRKQSEIQEINTIQKNKDLEKEAQQAEKIYFQFRGVPSRAAQAVQRLKKAGDLREQIIEISPEEPVIPINFIAPTHNINSPIVELIDANIGYDKTLVLKDVNLSINYGAKIGLLGRNGEGKSTLIKQVIESLKIISGHLVKKSNCKIGYLSQDLIDSLEPALTVYQQYSKSTNIKNDETIRAQLGKYGFPRDKAETKVSDLSGGELSRLGLGIICSSNPILIILDEPTNHLDVETREQLVIAIKNFEGSVLLVSHDWDLHQQCMKEFWLANQGTVKPYPKGLEHYYSNLDKLAVEGTKQKLPKSSQVSIGNNPNLLMHQKTTSQGDNLDTSKNKSNKSQVTTINKGSSSANQNKQTEDSKQKSTASTNLNLSNNRYAFDKKPNKKQGQHETPSVSNTYKK
ncbi:MAG: ATP-binding cassette domain-containing protein [Tatlockia sp.]|nr:ATP-binding cassette domain-containing protein [Tatlockia sp.]